MSTAGTLSLTGRGDAATAALPAGLAKEYAAGAGVTLRIYLPDGAPVEGAAGGAGDSQVSYDGWPDEGPAACRLTELVRRAAAGGPDAVEFLDGRAVSVFAVQRRGRGPLVAVASCMAASGASASWARRLLASVAPGVRARVAGEVVAEENQAAAEALLQSYEEVSLLHNLGEVLLISRPVTELVGHVCAELREVVDAEFAVAYLPGVEGVEPAALAAGPLPLAPADVPRLIAYLAEGLGREQSLVVNNHCQDDPALVRLAPTLRNVVMAPLPLHDGAGGAVLVANRGAGEFGSPEAKLVRSITGSCAVFVENHRLYQELQQVMLDLVRALVSSVEAKDPYTSGHSERVAVLSREIAKQMNLTPEDAELAYLAGLLHDIGKIGTPEHILHKPGPLTAEEWRAVRRHPTVGGRILANVAKLAPVREAVLRHHERLNGRGYPDGLRGDQVPLLARIVGLADAFDAMTSTRPYRPMMPMDRVRREIEKGSGSQFDARVVEAFLCLDLVPLLAACDRCPAPGEATAV